MTQRYNITFHAVKSNNDVVKFEESLDPYSAFRRASEDSTVPDQPLWGLLVWQVVGIFLLGLILICAVSCYCCERYSVRIPKTKTEANLAEHDQKLSLDEFSRVKYDKRRLSGESELLL
ncbi:hypothetical protein pdam_00010386 [Pocillopora damicornis]|uniref:Uncharacterized protein n=1 Tax=Pocillopora damicornis TaxID=46731 RepID=A0A3M6UQZ2_POCDA|nr:hypothetical protein pdam_00010386 [Pocillopora damicornis]